MTAAFHGLTNRTAHAARWRFATAAVTAVSQFAVGVLLARILAPADFGVMALALTVLGLAQPLGDLGIGGAIVQRLELTDRHVRTAFTFSMLLGLAITAALLAAAPLAGVAMRDRDVTPVLRALSAGFALRGTAVVAGALLRRRLDFRRQFFIEAGSAFFGYALVAVALALRGYGVWSLVWGWLFQSVVSSGAQLALVRHPIRPLLARRELEDLLHFGFGAALSSSVNYVALNGDNFIVGRWLGASSLGLYGRAYTLMNLPFTYAASTMSGVLFPAFAQVQGEPVRLRRAYLLMTRMTAMVAASSMATLAIAAPHLIRTIYGPQWTGVVMPLEILCLAGYFRALYHLGGIVAQSVGRVYSELRNQMVYAGLVIVGSLVGLRYGLPGVAAGVGVAILFMFIATGRLAMSVTGTPWRTYIQVQLGALVTGVVTGSVALSVRLLLEARQASSVVITFAILAAAAVAWSAAALWHLGDPGFEPVLERLPGWCTHVVEAMRGHVARSHARPLSSSGGR